MARTPMPGQLISVGQHRLHMRTVGDSPITVVFDHGCGGSSLIWSLVVPEVSRVARVVVYDRAGYGWSDSGPFPRTNETAVSDLHALLHEAKVPGPYILVGHSYGGINVRLYADRYPSEVAGLVLVDATHEDELTSRFPEEHVKGQRMAAKMYGTLANVAKSGLFALMSKLRAVPGFSEVIAKFPSEVQQALWQVSFSRKALAAAHSEFLHLEHGYNLVRNKRLGNIPLAVIKAKHVNQLPPRTTESVKRAIEKAMHDVAVDMSHLSVRGKLVVAEHSTHDIYIDEPEVIVRAVKQVVDAVKKK